MYFWEIYWLLVDRSKVRTHFQYAWGLVVISATSKLITAVRSPWSRSSTVYPLYMLILRSGSKLTFIEVLTINNYKITFLSNIQILTFINISNCEESLWENTIHKIANPIKTLFNIKSSCWERNVTGCVVFIIHIMVVFHSLTFTKSILQRREYHFVDS